MLEGEGGEKEGEGEREDEDEKVLKYERGAEPPPVYLRNPFKEGGGEKGLTRLCTGSLGGRRTILERETARSMGDSVKEGVDTSSQKKVGALGEGFHLRDFFLVRKHRVRHRNGRGGIKEGEG